MFNLLPGQGLGVSASSLLAWGLSGNIVEELLLLEFMAVDGGEVGGSAVVENHNVGGSIAVGGNFAVGGGYTAYRPTYQWTERPVSIEMVGMGGGVGEGLAEMTSQRGARVLKFTPKGGATVRGTAKSVTVENHDEEELLLLLAA